jgi:beta-1,4-N-acetylglucosaminyltransferase
MTEEGAGRKIRLGLVASPGGHIYEMYLLKDFWQKQDRFWITFDSPDTRDLLESERVYWVPPMPRYPGQIWKSFYPYCRALTQCLRIFRRERPSVVVSIGANIGASAIHAATLLGIRTIYIELSGRIQNLSLTGKMVYPVTNYFLVQWPELAARYPRARYEGRTI